MSKVVASLPRGLMKNSVVGAVVALVCYVTLQFIVALLIHGEMAGEEAMYPMVCGAAGLSSFLGCGYCVVKGGDGRVLSVSAVVLVFLALTAAVGLLTSEVGMIDGGLTGVGAAMAVGGLVAALVPGVHAKKGKTRRDILKGRRVRK